MVIPGGLDTQRFGLIAIFALPCYQKKPCVIYINGYSSKGFFPFPSLCFSSQSEWQVTSGNLERSYRRSPKGAKEEGRDVEGAGICHLCLGGQSFDWENLHLGFCFLGFVGFGTVGSFYKTGSYLYIYIYTCYMSVFPCSENVSLFLKYICMCANICIYDSFSAQFG